MFVLVIFLAHKVHLLFLFKGGYLLLLTLQLLLGAGGCTTKIATGDLYSFVVINDLGIKSVMK